jgi:hypothetical protein
MGSSPHSHRNHDTNEINDVMNKLDFSVLMTRGNDAGPVMLALARQPGRELGGVHNLSAGAG